MTTRSLGGAWTLRLCATGETVPGRVPGSVYSDLLRNEKMADPFYRDNEDAALALMENDYEYERSFCVTREELAQEKLLLRCEGIDTLAHVYVNEEPVALVDNMHRTWEFNIKKFLGEGENRLRIHLYSPVRAIRERYAAARADGAEDAMQGFATLRKAHCMFGWDWGPRLPDAGVWREISLVGCSVARLGDVYVAQRHINGSVVLDFAVTVHRFSDPAAGLRTEVELKDPDGQVLYAGPDDCLTVETPRLWWPRGYGEQPLYTAAVRLYDGGLLLDAWEKRIGLRSMTVAVEKDQWGESFAQQVNGVKMFAMGADYIPEDNLLPRLSEARTRRLLAQCAAANMNTVRVWGGGHYPPDYFYDLCDELGLVVWQDLMFACAVYNLTPAFEETVTAEVRDNVRRIRHHACLGLWCGNNEMEQYVKEGQWVSSERQRADYIKMYEYLFPKLLAQYDPQAFYWPSSPSSGGSFDAPTDPARGDVHDWEVWHGGKPFSAYRRHCYRYVSEFGFQSFPSEKTIEAFTLPAERNIFSYIMERHQRNSSANAKILSYLGENYLYPLCFGDVVYASQLLQAEAIRTGVEHWRRNRGRCMGAIYWQLNDCWPAASWSSIDYYGRWKALHYAARRFFAPVLLSCEEQGAVQQLPNVNAEEKRVRKTARLNVANETMARVCGTVEWELRDAAARVLQHGQTPVQVLPLESQWLPELDFSAADTNCHYLSYRLRGEAGVVSEGTVLFCPPKHFRFQDPQLSFAVRGDEITVTAGAYARAVRIANENDDLICSDNYFDLNGGQTVVKVLSGRPQGITLKSVYDIGRTPGKEGEP